MLSNTYPELAVNVEFAMVAKKGGPLLKGMEVSYEEEVIISISSGVVVPIFRILYLFWVTFLENWYW